MLDQRNRRRATLVSHEGTRFSLDQCCLPLIGIFKNKEFHDDEEIRIPVVRGPVLQKIVEWLEVHKKDCVSEAMSMDQPESSDDDSSIIDEVILEEPAVKSNSGKVFEQHFQEQIQMFGPIMSPWDQAFLQALDVVTLVELTKAANFLAISTLVSMCCRCIAGHMRGLSVEQLRQKFNIANDLTAEEEEAIRKEVAWCEE